MTETFGAYLDGSAKVYEAQLCIKLVLERRKVREAEGFLCPTLCFALYSCVFCTDPCILKNRCVK